MSAREIKDLAIAREALLRFPGNEDRSNDIDLIIQELIKLLAEEVSTRGPIHIDRRTDYDDPSP